MEESGLPPYFLPTMIAMGFVVVTLYAVNVGLIVIHNRDTKEYGKSSGLGKWSWWISLASLLIPYLAPISLVMASVNLVKNRKVESTAPHIKRPPAMALINSFCALLFIILILGFMVFRWTE
jgi:hypothetical protein